MEDCPARSSEVEDGGGSSKMLLVDEGRDWDGGGVDNEKSEQGAFLRYSAIQAFSSALAAAFAETFAGFFPLRPFGEDMAAEVELFCL